MELKFEQYTINGTPEEMATFLKLYELTVQYENVESGNGTAACGTSFNPRTGERTIHHMEGTKTISTSTYREDTESFIVK